MADKNYCPDCGSENLAYLEQYACGEHWKCKDCGKEICIPIKEKDNDVTSQQQPSTPVEQTRKILYEAKELIDCHYISAKNYRSYPTVSDLGEIGGIIKKLQSLLNIDKGLKKK